MGADGRQCTVGTENRIIAHYDLKAADVRAYGVSGHTLTVEEEYVHLLVGMSYPILSA